MNSFDKMHYIRYKILDIAPISHFLVMGANVWEPRRFGSY